MFKLKKEEKCKERLKTTVNNKMYLKCYLIIIQMGLNYSHFNFYTKDSIY